jgi:hypothetical protein
MGLKSWARVGSLTLLALTGLALGGCGRTGGNRPEANEAAAPAADECVVAGWCTEHRVPEELCAQCSAKLAAKFQREGNWCKQHNRPQSQCFLCDGSLEAKFAAEYEARYGRKPPKAQDKKS